MDKTVITYGTFDLFHIGHLRLLQRAKSLGNKLIVAVSTDEFNEIKGKKTIIPYEQRAEIVENIKCVDMVIPEKSWEQKTEDIKKYGVDVFVIGEDWRGKFDYLTTQLKGIIKSLILQIKSENVEEVISILEQIIKNWE